MNLCFLLEQFGIDTQVLEFSVQKLKMNPAQAQSAHGMLTFEALTPNNLNNRPTKNPLVKKGFDPRPSKDVPPAMNVSDIQNTTKANQAFDKANWQQALKNKWAKTNRFYKDEQVSLWVELDHFKMYGPGIYLFFNFMKNLVLAFLLMSIVEFVPSIYNFFCSNGLTNSTSSANYYLALTTIAAYDSSSDSQSTRDKYFNTIPDLVVCVIFFIFYFYWLHKSEVLTEKVRTQVKLKSYNVLQLLDPLDQVNSQDVSLFFSQFGTVKQVASVKNYDQSLFLSKKIYDYEVQIKEMQFKHFGQPNLEMQQKIKQKQECIDQIYRELIHYEDDTKQVIIKYFVTFNLVEEKQRAIKELQPYLKQTCGCCSDSTPQNYLLKGQKVLVKACHTQPGQIIWQNQHVTWRTRWIRAIVQYILLLTIIAVGFLFISLLNILAPSSSKSVTTSSYTSITILSETNSTIVQSWCISNMESVVTNSGSTIYNYCWSYIEQYYIKIAMTVGISLAVILIKAIIRAVVVYLAKFQRYKSHIDQSKDIIQNLFLTYLCTTVLITFMLQAQFSGISFKSLISYFISSSYLTSNLNSLNQYSDFVPYWYIDIGYQIFLTWIILAIHPALTMPLALYIQQKWTHWRAQDENVQANMQKRLQPPQFSIEDNYANILMIVFVSLAMSGGMPAINIVSFFAILFRYIYFKYTFLRYCRIPKAFDQALDNKVMDLLQYSLLIHFMISIWMFGVSSIFNYDSFSFSSAVTNLNYSFVTQIGFILDRLFATWYYSAIFLMILLVLIFKAIFYNLIAKRFMEDPKSTTIIPVEINSASEGDVDKNFLYITNKGLCDSYKIQNNPDYNFVLPIMHKKRKFVIKVKDLAESN